MSEAEKTGREVLNPRLVEFRAAVERVSLDPEKYAIPNLGAMHPTTGQPTTEAEVEATRNAAAMELIRRERRRSRQDRGHHIS